jgi:uncharacterized protein YjbI with pentapeptide repeats
MADDTILPGAGDTIRDIDKGGKKTQVMAIDLGGAGAESLLTTSMPITAALNALVDGAIVTLGAKADAKSDKTDATAITVMQVLKEMSYMLQNPASVAVTGTITANLSATDNAVLDAVVATLGATNGAAIITDVDGTVQQYLRGLIKLAIDTTASPVSVASGGIASGAMVDLGVIADAAVDGDAAGTVNAHLRGISKKIAASVAVTAASGALAAGSVAAGAVVSGAILSGAVASGAIASGAIASGAVASGAIASGALASGSVASGAMVDLGAIADAAVDGDAAGTVNAHLRGISKKVAAGIAVTPAATESHLGMVGGTITVITTPVVMTTHANYVANDFVGVDATALIFANAARVNTGSGSVIGATLIDYALQSVACELWLFDTAPAGLGNDSAAFTLTDAAVCIGVIPFSTYYLNALNSVSNGIIPNGQIPFKSSGTSIWGAVKTLGAPAYASSDLQIRLTISQD